MVRADARAAIGEEGDARAHDAAGQGAVREARPGPLAGHPETEGGGRMRTLLAVVLALVSAATHAQYPKRPVRVVVAAQTGGPDIVARVVAAELQAQMGQPFVVENQGGANGIVGATTVAKSAPDGYTLLIYSSGFVINPYVHKTLPYDPEKDFVPVTNLVSNGGLFFAVANSLPVKNMR